MSSLVDEVKNLSRFHLVLIVIIMFLVQSIFRFRHTNLITLMGYCNNPQALVYPYMKNLSLYDCIHKYKVSSCYFP